MEWFPKDVLALILGTCKYVLLHGQRDFADVVKIMDLKLGGYYPVSPGCPNLITWALKSRFLWLGSEKWS